MMISPGRGYVFVHIPKTGGTSLALALEARARADDILIGDTPKAQKRRRRLKYLQARGRLWKHASLADIDGVLSPADLASMFCFTVVRNPWDRAVSYYQWLQSQGFDHPAVGLAKSLPFPEFLYHPHIVASLKAWPAERYMTDVTRRVHCGMYLKLEQIKDDVERLAQRLNLSLEMPHVNQSARARDHRLFYDDALAAHLAQVCAADIAKFGYSFDG